MQTILTGDKLDVKYPYIPKYGSYAVLRIDTYQRQYCSQFHKCRETFYVDYNGCWGNAIAFAAYNNKEKIANFIREIEKRLNVQPLSEFGPTTNAKVMYIKFSPWWMENWARKNLFTILLRAGRKYEKSVRDTIRKTKYLKWTKYATQRFMTGHTIPTIQDNNSRLYSARTGWVNTFSKVPGDSWSKYKKHIDGLLVRK